MNTLRMITLLACVALLSAPPAPAQQPQSNPPAEEAATAAEPKIVVVPAGTRLTLVLRTSFSTATARPGQPILLTNFEPVTLDGRVVIPAGSEVYGVLAEVKRPGRSRGRGQALLHLERLVLPNRYDVTLDARLTGIETRGGVTVDDRGYLRGPSGRRQDAAEVTSTAGYSAMIGFGATFGHPKGALYGAAMGGGLALLAVKAARGPELEVPAGSRIEVVLERPLELATALLPPTGARP